jgi:hypothetical protein
MYGKTLPNETKRKITEKIILLYKQNRWQPDPKVVY